MAIQTCPSCDKKLKTPDGAEGKKIRCPSCQEMLLIAEDGLEPVRSAAVTTGPASKSSRKSAAEDDDDRPVKRRSRDDEDDDEDQPRRRSRDDDDDDDDDERRSTRKKKKRSGGGIPTWVWFAAGGAVLAVGIVLLFVFVLGGSNKFDKVKEGMTQQEVTDLLGKPALLAVFGGNGEGVWTDPPMDFGELLSGDLSKASKVKKMIIVHFQGGKVQSKQVQSSFSSSGFGGGNPFGGGGRRR